MKIGIFDSGVGGLTVLKSIYEKYPNNEYIYIGDNKNNPYGNKTKEELFNYASRIIDYFIKKDITTIVIACNTICSNVLNELKCKYKDINFIDVISCTVNEFIKKNKKEVLILATEMTIKSNIYEKKIKEINNEIIIHNEYSNLLVPLIENDKNAYDEVNKYINKYNIDSVILGCTHYKLIEKNINKDISIINSSDYVVNNLELDNTGISKVTIYITGNLDKFNILCNKIMNMTGELLDI